MLSFLIVCTLSAFGQKPGVVVSDTEGWHKIGETTVDFKAEKDEILVIGADKFAYVKIRVDKAPIDLLSFDIYFESGKVQNVGVGNQIKVQGESRVVQLEGGEQSLKKVVFTYKTVGNSTDTKAHVELWGKKTNVDKK